MKKLLNDYDAEQISATVAKWEIENDGDRWIPFKPDILKHPDNVKVERAKPEPHDPEDVPEDAPIREGNRAHMTEKTPQNSGPPSWFDSENIEPCGCDEKYQYREKGVGKHGYSDSYSTYQCFKCNVTSVGRRGAGRPTWNNELRSVCPRRVPKCAPLVVRDYVRRGICVLEVVDELVYVIAGIVKRIFLGPHCV